MSLPKNRIEHDLLGDKEIPDQYYFGVHTLRAVENFPITGTTISAYPELIWALASIKQASAQANYELGLLPKPLWEAITAATQEIQAGQLHDHFVVDVIQGGAGTSTNMNANEVICNRALEIMGHRRGEYQYLHPNDHVNLGQSTNDVYPTALNLATYVMAQKLLTALGILVEDFRKKEKEFEPYLKLGRTQLQDAVPMTLGQEFSTFTEMLEDAKENIQHALQAVCTVNLGATAIGSGITSHPKYSALAVQHLARISKVPVQAAKNLFKATQDCTGYVQVSSALKQLAVRLSKISNDLRLLSSGPRSGLGEINLPAKQAGSSIMPGKVNPVIPEVVSQVAFEVFGFDATITYAAESGQLQLNAFEPVIAHCLFSSIRHLAAACDTLSVHCVRDITVNAEVLENNVDRSISLVTALSPIIGYTQSTNVAKQAFAENKTVREVVLEKGLMTPAALERALRREVLIQPTEYEKA